MERATTQRTGERSQAPSLFADAPPWVLGHLIGGSVGLVLVLALGHYLASSAVTLLSALVFVACYAVGVLVHERLRRRRRGEA